MREIPRGFCQCGCGQRTKIAPRNSKKSGWIKGEPISFIHNHHTKLIQREKGEKAPGWKGGTSKRNGYLTRHCPTHPRANHQGYVFDHILQAEKTLGKYLPPNAVVHHHTEEQLVICQDQVYHLLLHRRQRAYDTCGHADWRKCRHCKQYDSPKNLYIPRLPRQSAYHRECKAKYDRSRSKNQ